jgi:hypothetical protein
VKNGEKGVLVDATRHPTRKVFSVLCQFHIASSTDGVGVDDGQIPWLVVAGWRGGYAFGHDDSREESGNEECVFKDWSLFGGPRWSRVCQSIYHSGLSISASAVFKGRDQKERT